MYDVIVIGAGAAGLTAAVYTCRKKLKTLVISADVGGQTNLTNHIENYPGVDAMPGPVLMQKFQENALSFGAELIMGRVKIVNKSKNDFTVETHSGEKYETKTVILAFGKLHKSLNIPGEDKFLGKGLRTCVTCDGPLFKNKTVVVIGGGNSAVEGVEELSRIAKKVYIVHRRDEFRADEITVDKVKKLKNVEFVMSHAPIEVTGEKFVKGLVVEDLKTKKRKELAVDGVFVEIGYIVDTCMVKHLVKLNERNEVLINDRCETNHPGIFAAGDVTIVQYKQTVISAGEGAKAALQAYTYLSGGKGSTIDWT